MSDVARTFLSKWHEYVQSKDTSMLDELVAEDALISSPAYYKPKGDRQYVNTILKVVTEAFEDFTYTKEWVDGPELILEFTAHIGDVNLKGIDRITLNEEGKIAHIEVLIRPMNALMALAEHVKGAFAQDAA